MGDINKLLDEFEQECFMLRREATETRAKNDVVRTAYERIRDEFAERITATLGTPEIVCCRDCKHCMAYTVAAYCDHMAHKVELDGFCAWGECKEVKR